MIAAALFSLDFWQFVGITAGVYAIFALGLQLQFGFTGLLNFGQVGFMAIGAYTMALLITETGMPMLLAGPLAIAVAMLFGLLVGLPALRLRADYLAITTIAFSEIIRTIILNWQDLTGGPQGLFGAWDEWRRFADTLAARAGDATGLDLDRERILLIAVWLTVLAGMLFLRRLLRSPWGRVLRAIREDEDAVNALGKDPLAYKLQAMAIGSAFAAVAGFFFSYQLLFINPGSFEPIVTFFGWVIILLGGTGRIRGVPIGAILFSLIFAGTRFLEFWPLSLLGSADRAALRMIIIGAILIGLMAFRPQGLFGRKEELLLER